MGSERRNSKTRIVVNANVNGMYRFPIGDFEAEGDILDFKSIVVRGEVTGEQAQILTEALSDGRVYYVQIEARVERDV